MTITLRKRTPNTDLTQQLLHDYIGRRGKARYIYIRELTTEVKVLNIHHLL